MSPRKPHNARDRPSRVTGPAISFFPQETIVTAVDYESRPALGGGSQRLFLACFFSIFATSSAFIVRAMVITEWGVKFNLTEAQKGAIFPGAALFPFAISIVLFSLFIDRLGYGKTMAFAVVAHLVGTIVTIAATKASTTTAAYQLLYFG